MGTSKSCKGKSIFHVNKIPYKTQDTQRNTTQEKHRVEPFWLYNAQERDDWFKFV